MVFFRGFVLAFFDVTASRSASAVGESSSGTIRRTRRRVLLLALVPLVSKCVSVFFMFIPFKRGPTRREPGRALVLWLLQQVAV